MSANHTAAFVLTTAADLPLPASKMATSSSSGLGTSTTNPTRRDPFEIHTAHAANDDAPSSHSSDANGHAPSSTSELSSRPSPPQSHDPTYGLRGPKSLSGISLRAFTLGLLLGCSIPLIALATYFSSSLWRPLFFLSALTLFHFLEYWTTARYNPSAATTSAFLLSQNGSAYNIAHTMAFAEFFLRHYFFTGWRVLSPEWMDMPMLAVGFVMLAVGQATRTMAMAHAGSNFNHLVQSTKKQGHELVTDGIYAWLRHPSYFGFWWWGLGTQVVLGNWVCLVGYAVVLWRFFSGRIVSELFSRD